MCFFLVACGSSDPATNGTTGGTTTGSTSTVTLGITDAPVDSAEEVVVQFSGVEFIPADDSDSGENTGGTDGSTGGDSGSTDGSGSGATAETTFEFETPVSIDLLLLTGSLRDTLLEGEELPAGNYAQIRLMVNAEHDSVMDSYIVIDGAQHELRVPSGSQSGLKLVHNIEIASDSSTDYTIDFDLRKSIVFAPGQGYMLKPVLRLVETEASAEITGVVNPAVFEGQTCGEGDPLDTYSVYLYEGIDVTADDLGSTTEPLTTANVALDETSNYAYTIGFIDAGDYTIAATCQANQDDPEADDEIAFAGTANISVTAGETTTHDFGQ